MSSIDYSSTEDNFYDGYICTNAFEEIRDISQIHPELKARDTRFKIRDSILKNTKLMERSTNFKKEYGKSFT